MKKFLLAAAILVAATISGAAFAASPSVSDTLKLCPDDPAAVACPDAAEAFLDARPEGYSRDAQIITLALAIVADVIAHPGYSMDVCQDAVDGLMALSKGVSLSGPAKQVEHLAEGLCHKGDEPRSLNSMVGSVTHGSPYDDCRPEIEGRLIDICCGDDSRCLPY